MHILIVEDDVILADGLGRALRRADYAVDFARTGREADVALTNEQYDLVILDLGLPEVDGLTVLQRVRARKLRVPVLILSARDSIEDRVAGLDVGADDYLNKPFDLSELEARVRALIRRGQFEKRAILTYDSLSLDTAGRRAMIDGKPLELSARELSVLETVMLSPGRVVSKEQMVSHLYEWNQEVSLNAIEVYIHRLRRKLEPAGIAIRTIRGLGYLLEAHP